MHESCMIAYMPTKTISLELDAYEILRAAKRSPRESFSQVVRRAQFAPQAVEGSVLLRRLREGPFLSETSLDAMAAAKARDIPPASKW